ncbi:MAG: hypothetical protein EOO55_04380 [Hymenobacter sp.]|nr:MAG: hypothetical protein EOO55_04380 [Hymenobacter sp.]
MLIQKKALAFLCLGFLFVICLSGCNHMTYPYQIYPFKVFKMPPRPVGERDYGHNYQIWAIDKEGLESVGASEYGDLFEEYGFSGNGESWREHIQYIIEEKDPSLLDHIEFDCNSDEFLTWADSEEAVQRFLNDVSPVFESEAKLKAHFKQLDPDDFME